MVRGGRQEENSFNLLALSYIMFFYDVLTCTECSLVYDVLEYLFLGYH